LQLIISFFQIVELLISPWGDPNVRLNLTARNRTHDSADDEFTPRDTFVLIRNNQLLSGVLDKSLLGADSKQSIFYRLLRDVGEQHAIDAMWRLGRISSVFISNRGFSIGLLSLFIEFFLSNLSSCCIFDQNLSVHRIF
jgi:DNA-directed RNA polymerase III subunit RPC1